MRNASSVAISPTPLRHLSGRCCGTYVSWRTHQLTERRCAVATQSDVRRIALSLPETVEETDRFAFSVRNGNKLKGFVWVWLERVAPRKARVPRPDVIAVRVANQYEKDLLLSLDANKFFTEPHYNGYPAVLVRLPAVDVTELEVLIRDAWRCQAPRALVRELDGRQGEADSSGA
jgi:hypothetical protein